MVRSTLLFWLAIQGFAQDAVTLTQQEAEFGKEGKQDQALREFKKASDLDPNYAPAYYNMGVAYEKTRETAEAINSYKKAVWNQATHILLRTSTSGALRQEQEVQLGH